jgi:hypothetical protein
MIPIGIQNLTASTLYVKEIQAIIAANSTFFIGGYDFFALIKAWSLKDAIVAGDAVIVRDNVVLSQSDSLIYLI